MSTSSTNQVLSPLMLNSPCMSVVPSAKNLNQTPLEDEKSKLVAIFEPLENIDSDLAELNAIQSALEKIAKIDNYIRLLRSVNVCRKVNSWADARKS
ncbi:hypothetical protein Gotur_020075 [Gossypium turneri]